MLEKSKCFTWLVKSEASLEVFSLLPITIFFMCIFYSATAHRRVPRSSELVEFVTFFLFSFFFLQFSPRRAQHKAAAEQRKKSVFSNA